MCKFRFRNNSININYFAERSNSLNFIQIILNSLQILLNLLCFISCSFDLILETGYLNYIHNIFCCFLMILISILINYYAKENYLRKDKKLSTRYFISLCISVTSVNFLLSFRSFLALRYTYLSSKFYNNKTNNELKQIKLLYIYSIIMLSLYTILDALYFIYIDLFRIINFFDNDLRNNISYLSTKSDINDNNQDIIINNLNERKKNNNFYFFSQNIINQIEKEYEDKESQTNIKGIMNK